MKQYKYFYKVTDENGQIIFNHRSDYAYRLLALAQHPRRRVGACAGLRR